MAADETLHYKNQSIFHAIGFILVVGVKLLTLEQPINGIRTSDISNRYAHLLLPAPVALTIIRSILYLALAAFVIYQLWLAFWGNHLQELTRLMTHMRHWWLISCVANAGWYFAWHYELMPFAFLLQLLLLVSLIAIHYNFAIGHAVVSRREKVAAANSFQHIPGLGKLFIAGEPGNADGVLGMERAGDRHGNMDGADGGPVRRLCRLHDLTAL